MGIGKSKHVPTIRETLIQNENDTLKNYNFDKIIPSTLKHHIQQIKDNGDYQCLVLSGGGVKGIAHCGALAYLEEQNKLTHIKNIVGTSAGAIIASMYAIGYSPTEIHEELLKIDFEKFIDSSINPLLDMYELIHDYGWCPGGYCYKLFGELIQKKTGDKDYTFHQLQQDLQMNLVLTGTDLNTKSTVYFCDMFTPTMSIRAAIRASMSIPYLFSPVKLQLKNGTTQLIVDGGMLDDCPEHVFDGEFPGDPAARNNLTQANPFTLALNIMTPDKHPDFQYENTEKISNLVDFSGAILETLLVSNERRYMRPCFWSRTISVRVPKIPLTQFHLSKSQKQHLYDCGYESAKKFME